MSDAEDREQEHREGLHEDTRRGDCPLCEEAFGDDSGRVCVCGHSEGSHVDDIVGGTWLDYCQGCDDRDDDDDVTPSHLFEATSL